MGLSVSGAFFLVGIILLLIWKLLTMLYDKMEYAHFESEINNPVWEKVYWSVIYANFCFLVQYFLTNKRLNLQQDTAYFSKCDFKEIIFFLEIVKKKQKSLPLHLIFEYVDQSRSNGNQRCVHCTFIMW